MTSRTGRIKAWLKKDFNLDSIPSCSFYHSQWDSEGSNGRPSIPYLIYRFVFMVTLISCAAYPIVCRPHLFYVLFTYWTVCLQSLYGTLYFFYIVWRKCSCCTQRFRGRGQEGIVAVEQQVPGLIPGPVPTPVTGAIPVSVTDNVTPTETGATEVIPSQTPTPVNIETVTPTGLNPSSPQPDGITSDNNNGDAGVLPVIIPINHDNAASDNGGGLLTILEQVIWILMNVTQTIPFIVAFVYWVLIYEYINYMMSCRGISNWYITHTMTAVLALIDALLVAIPVRLTHFIFPVLFISGFFIFSYIYEVVGGMYDFEMDGMPSKFIYSVINWKEEPGRAFGFCVLATFATCVFHTIACWGIYQLKLIISSRLCKRRRMD